MFSSGSFYYWSVCGSPRVPECVDCDESPLCWICADRLTGRGIRRQKWPGAPFAGQNKVRRVSIGFGRVDLSDTQKIY